MQFAGQRGTVWEVRSERQAIFEAERYIRPGISQLSTKLVCAFHDKPYLGGNGVHTSAIQSLHLLDSLMHQVQCLSIGARRGEQMVDDEQTQVDLCFRDRFRSGSLGRRVDLHFSVFRRS